MDTIAAFAAYENFIAKLCHVSVNAYNVIFLPAGDGMWVADDYGAICASHQKRILRRDGDNWIYEETNMGMSGTDKFCTDADGPPGEVRRYTKLAFEQEFPMNCEVVSPDI